MGKAPYKLFKVSKTLITVKAPVFTAMGMRVQNTAKYEQTDKTDKTDRQEKKDHLVLVKFRVTHHKTLSLKTMFTD